VVRITFFYLALRTFIVLVNWVLEIAKAVMQNNIMSVGEDGAIRRRRSSAWGTAEYCLLGIISALSYTSGLPFL